MLVLRNIWKLCLRKFWAFLHRLVDVLSSFCRMVIHKCSRPWSYKTTKLLFIISHCLGMLIWNHINLRTKSWSTWWLSTSQFLRSILVEFWRLFWRSWRILNQTTIINSFFNKWILNVFLYHLALLELLLQILKHLELIHLHFQQFFQVDWISTVRTYHIKDSCQLILIVNFKGRNRWNFGWSSFRLVWFVRFITLRSLWLRFSLMTLLDRLLLNWNWIQFCFTLFVIFEMRRLDCSWIVLWLSNSHYLFRIIFYQFQSG